MEFTGVELATPVEKVTTGLVEKAAAGGRLTGEGGRSAVVLRRGGDVGRRSESAMEREALWRAWSSRRRGGARLWSVVAALR
jgi:hypothetical protein